MCAFTMGVRFSPIQAETGVTATPPAQHLSSLLVFFVSLECLKSSADDHDEYHRGEVKSHVGALFFSIVKLARQFFKAIAVGSLVGGRVYA